ncbi:MAG: MFS transporter [Bacillota bacterium]
MDKDESIKKYTLISVMMSSFLTPFMGSAINLAIPSIGAEFNSSALQLSWVVSIYLLSSVAFLLPFGRLADIYGRKKMFLLGNITFSLASLLSGTAWSINSLIAFRVIQGIGGAMVFGTGMAILTSVYPPRERGKVLGINVATVYTGLSLGPVLGGFLNHNLGWESIFYFNALIGLAVVLMILTKLEGEWKGAAGESFDKTGAALYTVGIAAFLYGLSNISASLLPRLSAAAGLVLLFVFIRYEMKVDFPLLSVRAFARNTTFTFSNLAALINYMSTFAVTFLLSLYLQVVMGYNSQSAGMILLAQPVIMALLSPYAGKLSDRVEPRLVASWGMGLTTLGLVIMCFLSKSTPVWQIIITLAVLGTGFALFSSPNNNAVMSSVEKKYLGVASSTLGTMRLAGQAVSMAVATLIIGHYIGGATLTPAYGDLLLLSTRTAFLVFAVTCFAGIFASLARGDINSTAGEN